MATTTLTYGFQNPEVGSDEDSWGGYLRANWEKIDDLLDGTTVIAGGPVFEDTVTIVDPADNTKVARFDCVNITTGTQRTLFIPDASGEITLNAATQTLSNKTLSSPTITGGALSGTFTGAPTLSGNVTFSGNPALTGSPDFSGVGNAATIRSDLGLEIGSAVQAHDAVLDDIAGLTLSQGDVLYYNGSNLVNLGLGTAGQVLKVNSGATAPEWVDFTAACGVGQSWQDVSGSRLVSTSYQNTTGQPIMVAFNGTAEVSTDNATWVQVGNAAANASFIVPDDHYYRNSAGSFSFWVELR
jgi:hypothetical protein